MKAARTKQERSWRVTARIENNDALLTQLGHMCVAEALTGLRSRSCIIDGEAVACDDNGITFWFNRLDARSYQLVEAGEDALKRPG
jgi:ATP-dependent DNA ligase